MPKLDFHDVFLSEKEDVIGMCREIEKQSKAMSIIMIDMMLKQGIRSVTVDREKFQESLREANLNDPVDMNFRGNGDILTVSIQGS